MNKGFIPRAVILAAGLTLLGGCAKDIPPPDRQMALADAAMAKAESAEAYQRAPVELNAAREKLNRAQKLVEEERYIEAGRLAEEAEVDANLAYAKARTAAAQEAVAEVRKTIRTLQEEMERVQGR